MDSMETSEIGQKEQLVLADVLKRVGTALADLVPNSRPISRERPQADEEPRFSFDSFVDVDVSDVDGVHSLDEQR